MHFDIDFIVDLLVIAIYFVTVIYVGLKFGKQESNLADFALGSRAIPWWAVLASIIAAETSAATFIGVPGEGYALVNYTFLQMAIGTIVGRVIVAFLFLKRFYDLNVFSIYEFLEVRFGRGTRLVASATFLATRVLASGARLYVAAIVLVVGFNLFTGFTADSGQQLMIYLCAIVLVTIITSLYTSIGGIKAVIWTDLIQSSVMAGGAVAAIYIIATKIPGGVSTIANFAQTTPLSMFAMGTTVGAPLAKNIQSVLTTDYTIWAALLGTVMTTLATHGIDQDMVQRMLTAPDYKKSRLSLILSGLADVPIAFIFLTIGVLLHVYYAQVPDPNIPHKNSEIFAYFILKSMPVGLRGLLVAGIFATAMGSLSAALNALATSFTRDWYQPNSEEADGPDSVEIARKFTYLSGLLITIVASATAFFVIEHPDSRIIPIVLGIFGYTYGSLLGVFLLGLLTKTRGSDVGNYVAMIVGFIVVAVFTGLPGQILEALGMHPAPDNGGILIISFPWRIMLGSLTTVCVGLCFKSTTQAIAASSRYGDL